MAVKTVNVFRERLKKEKPVLNHKYAFLLLLLGSILSTPAISDEFDAARAVVAGPTPYLLAFSKTVDLKAGGVIGFAKRGLACEECAALASGSLEPRLTYTFFLDPKTSNLLYAAWQDVQRKNGLSDDFTLSFDVKTETRDCSLIYKSPCVSAPFCATGCDTVRGAPCVACTLK